MQRHWNWILSSLFQFNKKTVINHKFDVLKVFQEILYSVGRWVNEGSGWITESTDSQYINISIFRRLSGIS